MNAKLRKQIIDHEVALFRAARYGGGSGGIEGSTTSSGASPRLSDAPRIYSGGSAFAEQDASRTGYADAYVEAAAAGAATTRNGHKAPAVPGAEASVYWSYSGEVGRESVGVSIARFLMKHKTELFIQLFCYAFFVVTLITYYS